MPTIQQHANQAQTQHDAIVKLEDANDGVEKSEDATPAQKSSGRMRQPEWHGVKTGRGWREEERVEMTAKKAGRCKARGSGGVAGENR